MEAKNVKRAIGYFVISIATGLAVYQTPPGSWEELGVWIWKPAMDGVLAAMMSLGWNQVAK